jgi:hypothetical protein
MRKPLGRGDLLKIHWCDICECPTGNPDTAVPAQRISYGLFWAEELRSEIPCLITTTTDDINGHEDSGYCIYPRSNVLKIEVIRRAKVKK